MAGDAAAKETQAVSLRSGEKKGITVGGGKTEQEGENANEVKEPQK